MWHRNATIVELRQYTLHPGRRAELIELFEREFVEPQEEAGMHLLGLFCDARNPDRFVWLRSFSDMRARKVALDAFYGGRVWAQHRDAANATMADSNNVLLLRPGSLSPSARETRTSGPLLCVTTYCKSQSELDEIARWLEHTGIGELHRRCANVLATFVSADVANDYSRLPVREGVRTLVLILSGIAPEELPQRWCESEVVELVPTRRSQIQLAFLGRPRDFDFLTGEWLVTHCKLRERLRGNDQWETFSGHCRAYSFGNGAVSVDEFELPGVGSKGCSIRLLDLAAQRWSIHWTTSDIERLFPSVYGGFAGERGEFYGNDTEGGTPVRARYIWSGCNTPAPSWQQAFSVDAGQTWETNWKMSFCRG
jgi:hypothetical protein